MMKILFLTRRFFPDIGGVEKHVLEISAELVLRGYEVIVISESSLNSQKEKPLNYHSNAQSDTDYIISKFPVKSIQSEFFEANKIKNFQINSGKNDFFAKFRIWAQLTKFYRIFLAADVIHAHDVSFWYFPFRILFFWKKFYVTFHGYETNFPPRFGAKVIRKISEIISSGNICVGKYIEKWYGTRADFITYGGVKTHNSKLITQNYPKKNIGKLKILFLGRLEEDNGLKVYLDTLKILKMRKNSFNFIAVGDGKMRKKVEKWGKIIGFVKNTSRFIQNSDIVFSSSYLSMLEALIFKKRVFAVFENDLKRDYLKMSPFSRFVSINSDSAELADLILSKKSSKGYLWAKDQTWSKVADLYLKLWRK